MQRIDPITLQVFVNTLDSIAEEMGTVLKRTAFSPNIKEREDFSCALFTGKAEMIAQASHIPVHLGSMPYSTLSIAEALSLENGDVAILNDPFQGGTHLPDITMVAPVYYRGELLFYVANRAHHADVGGMSPGSMPLSTNIFQEGLIIPPVKIIEQGHIKDDILKIILSNVRTPEERKGDLEAQIASVKRGILRVQETIERFGKELVVNCVQEVINYTEKVTRAFIKEIPDGVYEAEDFLEDIDGKLLPVKAKIAVQDDTMIVDFSESALQTSNSLNAVRSITLSCVLYVIRCLLPEDVPTNQGLLKPVKVLTKKGTVVDAARPAALSGGNVETSQRIVDVLLLALSKAIPQKVPAMSQGTMNNVLVGNNNFVYYETIGGGMGACPTSNGESAIHSHMTNTMNTPIEALEFAYPLMVREYKIRARSGGAGKYRGGDGIIRSIELLEDAEVTILSQRRNLPPKGLNGGNDGKTGKNILIINGNKRKVDAISSGKLCKGTILRIETPGGGGYGKK
ncbi:N-methylhydantoinase B [Thermosulfidibacter takaii ABI70S6]|uniref:N-methylhydantoinase B n=1 Tax=Thermosulfidibacter takaii (strain DSM 17441 / JCM 13301 / NBRC 103674 / ABI70S6) TaxID=1298851 RepID=A0A0S3QTA5_THET7|nr:hydantoinase B/oxoprolinase family protein [Thermosulfidibacter takaii]BAT71562.1 N-methylhydantoinase B [Thermosulfidibacter takaii ABI70S6]